MTSRLDPLAVVVQDKDNFRVVLCARYCAGFVLDDLLHTAVRDIVEPEVHWSMEIHHSTSSAEEDCR